PAGRVPPAAAAHTRPAGHVVKAQILYWRDLPSAVKVWDEQEELKFDLPQTFSDRIDVTAQRLGFTKGDDYIAQFRWGEEFERAGAPAEVAAAIVKELEVPPLPPRGGSA
ncbi:MAG: hypothetical protein FJ399_23045, partial [Verrucomicrobia bacterium]|nr:hypothetical protein [Verrucomicrobiota bacterium]